MPARGTNPDRDFARVRGDGPAAGERPVTRDLAPPRDDAHLRFALRVALPHLHITTAVDEDGVNAWLHDGAESWATLSALGDGETIACQGGSLRLADQSERAWDEWISLGRPDLYDYGLTVQPDRQYAWCLDAETGPRWQ